MKYFRLAQDFFTRKLDVYEEHCAAHPSTVFQYVSQIEPRTFEQIASELQKDGCDGYTPGPEEIAMGLVLLIQAGLVEIV